ncbi:MAG: phosphatase [Defluviitaleaceae bacterium]|nr:phosphatase [Defluviitaleaceae bacterium]
MKFILDPHIHTVVSGHAYSTISENAAHAASIGLTHIGITDHGPDMPGGAHLYAFSNQICLPDIIHGVRVLKSAEVNIVNGEGKLDIPSAILKRMDYVIASLHRGIYVPTDKDAHTKAMIKAMEKPAVSILGHPGCIHFEIDIEKVVAAAARTGTIIEINSQTLNPDSFRYDGEEKQRQLLELCKAYEVPVVASSDAHFCTLVGEMSRAKALIEEVGMPESLVLNMDIDLFFVAVNKKRDK